MKKPLLLIIALFIFGATDAQNALRIKKINFSHGSDSDMIDNMSYHYFVDQIPADVNFPLRNIEFQDSDFFSGVCENPNLAFGLTLAHDRFDQLEWRNTFSYMKSRYDQVSYYEDSGQWDGDYVSFHGTHNEMALESAILYRVDVLPFLKLYGGAGTNIGLTTDNHICYDAFYNIPESEIEGLGSDAGSVSEYENIYGCFDTKSQLTQRVFYEVGVGIRFFKRVELGLNHRRGIGYRAGNGAHAGTTLNSTNLSIAYVLK